MKSETFMDALTDIDERYVLEAAEALDTPRRVRPRRRLGKSLLIAAVLVLLLTPAAFAVYGRYLNARVPASAVHVTFIDDEAQLREADFPNVAMVVNADVSKSVGHLAGMRFGWLPEGAVDPAEKYLDESHSLLGYLDFLAGHLSYQSGETVTTEQLLDEAGLSADEADAFYTSYHWETADGALLQIGIYDASSLYQRDLLLGTYGGVGTVVAEGQCGPYEMQEIQIDYREFYKQVYERNGHMVPEVEWFKNYLFLFEPNEEYLILIGGSDAAFPFETLERIADNLEVRLTDYEQDGSGVHASFLLLDLGRG